MKKYDVIVVGGGPGGYVAAEHAASAGHSVALIEKEFLGGTCLNSGCIPSKTLLRHAEVIELIDKASKWGITCESMTLSFDKMMNRQRKVIRSLRGGVEGLLANAKVTVYSGIGTVHKDHTVTIESGNETDMIYGEKIILATGSRPSIPPIPGIDKANVHTSDTIFSLENLPESIVIIGGGVIGVEFACIFSGLNCDVTIVEMSERLIPEVDPDAAELLLKKFNQAKNITVHTAAKIVELDGDDETSRVHVQTDDGDLLAIETELVLAATGRVPIVDGFEKLPLTFNGSFVAVNRQMETSIPSIYAIGDVVGGAQLAHVASAEGIVAAENAINEPKEIDYHTVPHCIYTSPEIATVGLSENEAKEKGYHVRTHVFPLAQSGKAFAMDETTGFIKLIADDTYDEILGVVMIGPHVTEMIAEASAYVYLEGTVTELADMIHPHPTLSEGLNEAAKAWLKEKKYLYK